MPSKKSIDELEYNVFKKDLDTARSSGKNNGGCAMILGVIVLVVVILVAVAGIMQLGSGTPSVHCAYPGCQNRLKPGSSYCWLHSKSDHSSSKQGGTSSSSGGSVIGGSSSSDSSSKKNDSIWGNTERKANPYKDQSSSDLSNSSSASDNSSSGSSISK